jgi:hypothetical protein
MPEETNAPETTKQEANIQLKRIEALIEDDIFKLKYELVFAYIDTINNIRKKLSKKLGDEFAFDFKYKHDIVDSRRQTSLNIEVHRSGDYLSTEDINTILDTLGEIFKEEGIEQEMDSPSVFPFLDSLNDRFK